MYVVIKSLDSFLLPPIFQGPPLLYVLLVTSGKDFDPPADACICSEHFIGGKN